MRFTPLSRPRRPHRPLRPGVEPLEGRRLFAFTAPYLSEFLASNNTVNTDADGQYSDWVEIHNPTAAPVSLDGWFLTDDPTLADTWRIPNVTIPANGYKLVW